MAVAADSRNETRRAGLTLSPLIVLGGALVCVMVLMTLPIVVPIGPMYWDVFIYYDAAARIFDGQVPVVDFFTPVGPLGYWLFAAALAVFPDAQPTLIAHWSLLPLTAPLMALVLWDTGRGGARAVPFALLVPFLIFALLPFNTREFYPFPGSDGFGIYNRQVCQLLYVLASALVFMRSQRLLAVVIAVAMTALLLVKVTGVVSGAILCVFAFMAGRVALRTAIASLVFLVAVLGGLELWNGMISHYARDILSLVEMNSESLAPRFLQAASHTFGVIAPGGALVLMLLWWERERIAGRLKAVRSERGLASIARVFDLAPLWLAVAMIAGVFFETQNTGSQAMIMVWPMVLMILLSAGRMVARPAVLVATFGLAAATALPPAVSIVERAARAYAGSVKNEALEHRNLRSLGTVSMRPDVAHRATVMSGIYPRHRETYADIVENGILPNFILYSEFDFQILHLQAIDRAIDDLRALETERGIRFETMMTYNFVNPFPWLMGRSAPRHIAIGADPTRAVPRPGAQVAEALGQVDIALYPTCPLTTANAMLFDLYRPFMPDHRRIRVNACYDAWIHPRFGIEVPD
ncbi:MAG: hypothetical protein K5872_19615 [Rhizobiaceae bacterium]|nr:hypothetical protein [Rhizobiaceae bacterium]MCV0408429.1 hypothetical protein [Rhizobiaceae bacterium]